VFWNDGANDIINSTASALFDFQAHTCCWFQMMNGAGFGVALFPSTGWATNRAYGMVSSGAAATRHRLNYAVPATHDFAWVTALATRYHFGVTFDPAGAGFSRIYHDGIRVSTQVTTGALLAAGVARAKLGGNGATLLNGYMGDARIYDRALTDAEISTIHACNGADGIVDGLVARWPLNDVAPVAPPPAGAGDLKDHTPNALHATWQNAGGNSEIRDGWAPLRRRST